MKMSPEQNNALHLWFERVAEKLNEAGYDMKSVLEYKAVDVPWTKDLIKTVLAKPLIKVMFNKTSTKDLTKSEVGEFYDVLDRFTGQNFGIHVDFPNEVDK